ncbi:unnamed protein product [Lymnaea stagnalis]|uniref:DNA-directed RNA polymerase subunit n=1 Tax=Lymnaea stagnalis TaxID=6523 RepID=A0AAV2I194_LYMST
MDSFHWILNNVDFRFYSKSEILQLSVKEIFNPQTFDVLQNPVIGGLHDIALGPCRRDERCESCGQSEKNCPGHFGHIKLPVLLFNPILFKVLLKLLKGSCMCCHRIKLPLIHIKLYTYQLELLERGLLVEAQDLEEKFLNCEKSENVAFQEMQDYVRDVLHGHKTTGHVLSKNVITLHQIAVRTILNAFTSSKSVCLHCQTRNRTLKAEYNRTIVGTMIEERSKNKTDKTKVKKDQEENEVDANGDDAVEMDDRQTSQAADENSEQDKLDSGLDPVPVEAQLQTELDHFIKSKHKRCILSPNVAREHVRLVWEHGKEFLQKLFPFLAKVNGAEVPTDVFFLDVIPVPPSRFRPLSIMKERKYEHPQTANLSNVLRECVTLKDLLQTYSKRIENVLDGNVQGLTVQDTNENMTVHVQKIMASWLRLQSRVNIVLDNELDKLTQDSCIGVRQLLEKKEGLLRMHMMGKRVNYAARSVISPDPYIATNEIGVPMVFASKLTFPQRVTPWNVHQLRQMVINGPLIYPGAVSVINEDGTVTKLNPANASQREAIAKQLLVPDQKVAGSKTVCRHLINGDLLLLNRQPTLHRPSMQAHKARVLPAIKTLRMHYSNCKAYNADFDGDEMNAHFPQCELSRAEASYLALTDYNYLVPKDSTPLAGLIQDHMVSGVALTIRGRFFSRRDYCGLVWSAMNDWREKIDLLPPTIIRPDVLWSGKQVISTILLNIIPKGKGLINLKGKAKIPEKSWTPWVDRHNSASLPLHMAGLESETLGESTVIIRHGELLQGVLDKAHYGPSSYGLVHGCYELYGGEVAGKLLTYLGRLFTSYLQMSGFSMGVGDILVQKKGNRRRKSLIKKSQNLGKEAAMKAFGLSPQTDDLDLLLELKKAHFDKDGLKMAELDMCMKGETDRVQDDIAKSIMPSTLEKGFPENSLQLMVQSGAKGSPVNCMQISCLLGQIELEGRRPPLMLSGRSLPSFLPYDVSPKAGGFVTGRFLTGIRPQEYFFHCMAGREGLIDTAVKTSRSGYLQRCLVKHLEGLMVNYDLTVRDNDGGLVQFYYGEDGLEPVRSPYLQPSQFPFLTENLHVLLSNSSDPWLTSANRKEIRKNWKRISKWRANSTEHGDWHNRNSGFIQFCKEQEPSESNQVKIVTKGKYSGRSVAAKKLCKLWEEMDEEERQRLSPKIGCPDPVMAKYQPHSQPDVMGEKFRHLLNVYCKKSFHQIASQLSLNLNPEAFKSAMNKKLVQALADPGEAVGLVCAQSIGEPSTQMTLNTFHFAGRGEMNVTLGIPRLREILMTASARIKTPSMDIPVQPGPDNRVKAERLYRHLNKITMDRVVEHVKVKIYSTCSNNGSNLGNSKMFEARIKFLPHRNYKEFTNLTPKTIMKFVVKHFVVMVDNNVTKENTILERASLLSSGRLRRTADKEGEGAENKVDGNAKTINADEDLDIDANDGDATAVKEQLRQQDTQGYEGEEEEQKEVQIEDNDSGESDKESSESDEDASNNSDVEKASKKEMTKEANDLVTKEGNDLVTQALMHGFVHEFKMDEKKYRSCEITFSYEQSRLQLDVRMLLKKTIQSAVLHQVKGINQAFLSEEKENGETVLHLKTEGVNIQEMFKYPETLDLDKIYSNCIHTIAQVYGIEAANRVIIKEIQNVFGAYGITVDYHHLSLLADYMTSRGQYDAFNRRDFMYNTSPFQKMTFETTMNFLLDACVLGSVDSLKSPSASLIVGKVVGVGTGCFDILDPLR